jgi:hypothetical protein
MWAAAQYTEHARERKATDPGLFHVKRADGQTGRRQTGGRADGRLGDVGWLARDSDEVDVAIRGVVEAGEDEEGTVR